MEEELKELVDEFKNCAQTAFGSILGLPAEAVEEWTVRLRLAPEGCAHSISLGHCNDRFQAACFIGAPEGQLDLLMPGLELSIQLDGLGEIGNNICGLLADSPKFSARFGSLEQTPPLISTGTASFPRAWAVLGKLQVGDGFVFYGYTIRDLTQPIPFRRA